ncbi:MAG: hypothetical protein ACNA75_10770 [Thiohalomonadaceae bacterium]
MGGGIDVWPGEALRYDVTMRKIILLLLCLPLLAACSARIVAPVPLEQPRAIFVLDHGRHSSLVLSRADGSLLRYSYGDWRYYAEGEIGFWDGLRAVFVPTAAAMGRRELPGPADAALLPGQVRVLIVHLHAMQAEAARLDQLIVVLEGLYQDGQAQRHYRADFDLEFVPHPVPYTLWHNSNRVVAEWLMQLGLQVEGRAVLSRWQVDEREVMR